MRIFLGIDGGGTKTASVILDERGRELGRGQGGPCNIASGSDETLRTSICDAVAGALAKAKLPPETRVEAVCAGVAGYTARGRRADFARLLAEIVPAERYRMEPDYVIAYWGATEGEPGIIVIAGTGAVVYGENAERRSRRYDGLGWLLGDYGSGFDIGKAALLQTVAYLEAGESDVLGKRVMKELGATDLDDVIEMVYRDFRPDRVASLASVVGQLATHRNGDALLILDTAASALFMGTLEVINDLDDPPQSLPIYLLGGLWKNCGPLASIYREYSGTAVRVGPTGGRKRERLQIRQPRRDAAYGAALLAMREEAR